MFRKVILHLYLLPVGLWRWKVSNGRERQCGPVERLEVHARHGRPLALGERVAPATAETLRLGDHEVEGGEPVWAEEEHMREVDDAPRVRVDGARLHHVHEPIGPVQLEEAGKPQDRVDSYDYLSKI